MRRRRWRSCCSAEYSWRQSPRRPPSPGDNGRIAFTSDRGGNAEIYARAQRSLVLVTDFAVPMYTSERKEVLLRITTTVRHMVEHTNR